MEKYIDETELSNYLILPQTFDWDLVDQEIGFAKIFDVFSEELYLKLKDSEAAPEQKIFKLLSKAGAYYSFIFSIPKLKVHISNYGIDQFDIDKVKTAPWWDVRDLGLAMLKVADKNLSDAITLASRIDIVKEEMPYFKLVTGMLTLPEEFQSIYPINFSPDVFLQLQKFINQALLLKLTDQLNEDCLELVKSNPALFEYLKSANAFYALYFASLVPAFVFTQNAVVVQYEELPWQKSVVLDQSAKIRSGENFLLLGDQNMKIILDYIKKNKTSFPCYSEPSAGRKMQSRPSGIYL